MGHKMKLLISPIQFTNNFNNTITRHKCDVTLCLNADCEDKFLAIDFEIDFIIDTQSGVIFDTLHIAKISNDFKNVIIECYQSALNDVAHYGENLALYCTIKHVF